jgi:hypothetical protein
MTILAAQYLESIPDGLTPQKARDRLRRAFDLLPLTHILLGWQVPPGIEAAVAKETSRYGAKLHQWHPVLTGDAGTPRAWQTVSLLGEPIPGHLDLPEFTFLCPNRPEVQELIATRVEKIIQGGIYQGLFLDRIRFPSPAASAGKFMGCFCEHCIKAAGEAGWDLEAVRRAMGELFSTINKRIAFVRSLFGLPPEEAAALEAFLHFRADAITSTVRALAKRLEAAKMEVGLDCFSPSLAWMVGQDLARLQAVSTWTKVMTYAHTFAPAGLPFELLGLMNWLDELAPGQGWECLRRFSGLRLPRSQAALARKGLPSRAIQDEIALGRKMGIKVMLAGLALAELPGINMVNLEDLAGCGQADGMVISWDLWHVSDEVLGKLKTASWE